MTGFWLNIGKGVVGILLASTFLAVCVGARLIYELEKDRDDDEEDRDD